MAKGKGSFQRIAMRSLERALLLSFILFVFSLGWLIRDATLHVPAPESGPLQIAKPLFEEREKQSPSDWISEDQIKVYPDEIVLDIQGAAWAKFADTNSMDPIFDIGHNAIEITPTSPEQIQPGDIIAYNTPLSEGTIIHRVVEVGDDGEWYAIVKGDNNSQADPEKVRFSQVDKVLVAIIY